MIEYPRYPELVSTQAKVDILDAKLRELIDFVNENTVEYEEEGEPELREGVTVTANGRYMLGGKFIPKSEAYL